MKTLVKTALLAAFAVMGAWAQPTIAAGGILNNASYEPSGVPNGDIAQGSIFVIFGTQLGPPSITYQAGYPLQTTIGGTSIKVTVNGTTVDAIPLYTVAGQVGAILPSRTPVGTGTVTVTYNNQTSASAPIKVTATSFGVFAVNQAGTGPGVVTSAASNAFALNNAAHPGDTVIIWGTGLGAVTGSETAAPVTGDLTAPVQVYIGGKQALVRYHGRSGCCAGLDQINVDIPQGVDGCYVGVVVVANNIPSNVTTLPVSAPGTRTCSDANGLGSSDLTTFLSQPSFSLGAVSLSRITTPGISIPGLPGGGAATTLDGGSASFVKYDTASFNNSLGLFQQASFGSCIVTTLRSGQLSTSVPQFAVLDAGAAINVNGPNGTKLLTKQQGGTYSATLGGGTAGGPFIPANGGSFRFDNGSGGVDVKGFNVTLPVSAPLVWTNIDAVPTTIVRSQGQTVTWSGGDPNSYVTITGSTVSTAPVLITTFSCTERVSAGSFTVPGYVLLALLPNAGTSIPGVGSIPSSALSVFNSGNPVKFNATGIDVGYATWTSGSTKLVNYQ